MKILVIAMTLVVSLFMNAPFAHAQQGTAGLKATVELKNSNGRVIGNATFTQQADGVRITVQVSNLTMGRHGIHIHSVGRCDPPDFKTAGGHFNPEEKKHGLQNPSGPHAGDLPNIEIAPDGTGSLDVVNPRVSLDPSARNSLFKPNGTALVIHANPDDEVTDPAGNSGPRVACGVIVATWETIIAIQSLMSQSIQQKESSVTTLQAIISERNSEISALNQQIMQSNIIAAVAVGVAILAVILAAATRPKATAT